MEKDKIAAQFAELVSRGTRLLASIPQDGSQLNYWVPESSLSDASAWMVSAAHLVQNVASRGTQFFEETGRIVGDSRREQHGAGMPSMAVARMLGLLRAAEGDWKTGMLGLIEYTYVAATFDDFLGHAEDYQKGGHFREAAVLASAVLEDAVRKVCQRHSVPWEGKTLFPRIDALEAAGVVKKPEATRAKRWGEVRNKADHAEWEKIDGRDIADMIAGIRDFMVSHL